MKTRRSSIFLGHNLRLGTLLLGLALGLGSDRASAQAQPAASPAPPTPNGAVPSATPQTPTGVGPWLPAASGLDSGNATFSSLFSCCGLTPCCPDCCAPVNNIPYFLGDFFARGLDACRTIPGTNTVTTRMLTFTGLAGDNNVGFNPPPGFKVIFFGPFTNKVNANPNGIGGPGGPYNILSNVTGTVTVAPFVKLNENVELTTLIDKNFPGATFVNGTGNINGGGEGGSGSVLFNYLLSMGRLTPGSVVCVNLADPSGGGLVGRNNFFDNGSPVPHDRVYFFYNHIGDFRGLGSGFDVNRYVFGVEKAFFDNLMSVELRVPFAGTANSDQVVGQDLSVGHTEFGNLGLAFKAAVYRSPNFLASVGLGLSFPTADDSRMLLNGQPVIDIQNHAVLLQPLLGIAWAPNDRLYAQLGWQLDFDPSGNPVRTLDTNGLPYRAGVLHDQHYSLLSGAVGCWVYKNKDDWLTGVAMQGELHYDASFGPQHFVNDGNVSVADLNSRIDVLNATAGVICNFGERSSLSLGASFPLTGGRLYDWALIAQVNFLFGPRIP
jgi:hypothetical protein